MELDFCGHAFHEDDRRVVIFTGSPFPVRMANLMVKAKITKIEGETATLSLADGQTLLLRLEDLEGECTLGQEVAVLAVALGSEDAGRQKIAQHLLNELLKS